MTHPFDPYYRWLGIPPRDQPPTLYRLLGVEPFESDLHIINSMASRHIEFLQEITEGSHVKEAQQLLNELAAARRCLLDPKRKTAYDAELKAMSASHHKRPKNLSFPQTQPSEPLVPISSSPTEGVGKRSPHRRTSRQQGVQKQRTSSIPVGASMAVRQRAHKKLTDRNRSLVMLSVGGAVGLLALVALVVWLFSDDGGQQNRVVATTPEQGRTRGLLPMQGLPMQGLPMQGLPMQGHPTQGHPTQGHPTQGHLPPGQLLLWLDSSDLATLDLDEESRVDGWMDKSGNACHASVNELGARPQLVPNVLGDQSVVRFSGSKWLEIPGRSNFFRIGSEYSFVFVARGKQGTLLSKGTGETDTSFAMCGGATSFRANGRNLNAQNDDASRFRVRSIVADTKSLRWFVDGAGCGAYPGQGHAVKGTSRMRIGCFLKRGRGTESFFQGDLAELIIYGRRLEDEERRSLEEYLRLKWLNHRASPFPFWRSLSTRMP